MKKVQSLSFQIDVAALQKKRLLTLYKRLQQNRTLTRFCREAFMEKADRYLNGLEPSYAKLNQCIKEKGIEYVLEAIKEKTVPNKDENLIQQVADKIKVAILNELQKESSPVTRPIISTKTQNPDNSTLFIASHPKKTTATEGNKIVPQNKPDIDKLKALLLG